MNHWWVNQNQTYAHEVGGGYLWSPKVKANGSRNRFYDTMTETRPGDVVFSFCDTLIKAVGVVTGEHDSAPTPSEFGATGAQWGNEGWYVPVDFVELKHPITPKDHMDVLLPVLPNKYSPLQANGNGNQGVYLAEVSEPFAQALRLLLQGQVESVEGRVTLEGSDADDAEQKRVQSDASITETERRQLVSARIGQGLFRSRVELIEPMCRLTRTTDRRFLRASHIKPWSKSTHEEKLDGNNGLMLSPHVDHLFDRGFISFHDDGTLLLSSKLPSSVLADWGLQPPAKPVAFKPAQRAYLAYHREHVLLGD